MWLQIETHMIRRDSNSLVCFFVILSRYGGLVRVECVANKKLKIFFVFFDDVWFANLLRLFMLRSLLLSRPAEQRKRLSRY